ncbi:hypothetical protein [Methanolobus sp.]|uniref:hypothetical protein n=1 Tax=Methanolobus sp. TaxID=1874737 RepID=UPI0025E4AC23|nr:hypothetical protein [Methanolobus sp.]
MPKWARTENGDVKLGIFFYEDVLTQDSIKIAEKYSENFSATSKSRSWYYETITNETNITLIASEDAVQHVGYYDAQDETCSSDFVDYEVITEEDETDPVDEQEDEIQEVDENIDEQEEKKSPGFTSTIGILIFGLVAVFSDKERARLKRK